MKITQWWHSCTQTSKSKWALPIHWALIENRVSSLYIGIVLVKQGFFAKHRHVTLHWGRGCFLITLTVQLLPTHQECPFKSFRKNPIAGSPFRKFCFSSITSSCLPFVIMQNIPLKWPNWKNVYFPPGLRPAGKPSLNQILKTQL